MEQSPANKGFRVVGARGPDGRKLLRAVLGQLEPLPSGSNLGFLYVSGVAALMIDEFVSALRRLTGLDHWIGAVAEDVMVPGTPEWCADGVVIAVGSLPEGSFELIRRQAPSAVGSSPGAILHVDATLAPEMVAVTPGAAGDVIGGIIGSAAGDAQIVGNLASGGISGLILNGRVGFCCRQSQGCAMLGPFQQVTAGQPGVIRRLDGRPLVEVLREQIGDILVRRPERLCDHVFLAAQLEDGRFQILPIQEIDLDASEARLAVRRFPTHLAIALREPRLALSDLKDQLRQLRFETAGQDPVRLAIHFASSRRARGLFGPEVDEPAIVQKAAGGTALIGATFNQEVFGAEAHAMSSITAVIG